MATPSFSRPALFYRDCDVLRPMVITRTAREPHDAGGTNEEAGPATTGPGFKFGLRDARRPGCYNSLQLTTERPVWIRLHLEGDRTVSDLRTPRPRFRLRTDVPVLAVTILGLIVSYVNAR
jgi:hypothetical protein